MEALIRKEEEKAVVEITGRLDTVTSQELKAQLEAEGLDGLDIDLDFTNVEYISSAGLRLLVALQKQAAQTEHHLVVRHINNVVAEVFKVAGFDKVLTVE